MFQKLWGMLQNLEAAKGSKAKELLLKKYVGDPDFVWMAKNALDQGHSFGVEEFPAFVEKLIDRGFPGVNVINPLIVRRLEEFKCKAGVTDADITELYNLVAFCEKTYNVVVRILRKDLRCGVAAKTINKVSPGLIFRCGYQRCATADFVSKITYPALLQKKANAMFAYLLPDGSFMTRKGERAFIPENPVSDFAETIPYLKGKVLGLELGVVGEDGKFVNRAKSNGAINAFFKGGGDPEIVSRIRAVTWLCLEESEFLAGKSRTPYGVMFEELSEVVGMDNESPLQTIETWEVESYEEAMAITRNLIRDGEEGTVLKSLGDDFFWADEDPSYCQVKLKAEAVCSFRLISAYEGDAKKKYAGKMGGITIASEDGLIVSDCGSGFSDAQRDEGVDAWAAKKGAIVDIKFNGITEPNEDGVRSLEHPRFIEDRSTEKTEADTYSKCLAELTGVVE